MLRLNSFRSLASFQLSPPLLATLSPNRKPPVGFTPKSARFPHAQLGVLADQAVIFRTQAREMALERRVAEGAERHWATRGCRAKHVGCC